MKKYAICYDKGIKSKEITASSYEEAFINGVGDYIHREVKEDDFYDVIIDGDEGPKYFWIRWGWIIMKVYTIRHTKNNIVAKVENINDDLKSLQRIVGGHIEVLPISNEVPLIAIVNETGKLDNLPPTAAFIVNNNIADIIVGNIIVCRVDGENMADIIEEIDISIIYRALAVLK